MTTTYYYIEKDTNAIRRIDSDMVEPLHAFGYIVIKVTTGENPTEEWLFPDVDIPDGYIVLSKYGELVILESVVRYLISQSKREEVENG